MIKVDTMEGIPQFSSVVHRQSSITPQHSFRSCSSSAVSDVQYSMSEIQRGQVMDTFTPGSVSDLNIFIRILNRQSHSLSCR